MQFSQPIRDQTYDHISTIRARDEHGFTCGVDYPKIQYALSVFGNL